MGKYPISREFFPASLFTPRLDRRTIETSQKMMGKVPKSLIRDPALSIQMIMVPGYKEGYTELTVMTPIGINYPAPGLLVIHGGGFIFEASSSHYIHAANYAKGAGCIVAFVRYRLAPEYPFPYPQEDAYAALSWLFRHASELHMDPDRIGVTGDSAGGTLAVTSCMMARDRGSEHRPVFQLLVYPFLDNRGQSESHKKFTDTPMWNSSLSRQVGQYTYPVKEGSALAKQSSSRVEITPLEYRSPVEAESLADLPPAYIEVAEFDALHDDGVLYSKLLKEAGVEAELHETAGTMHGFDYVTKAPTTKRMEEKRIEFMKRQFNK